MKILNEKLTEKEAKETGLAELIYDALIDEWEAIRFYDTMISAAKAQGNSNIVSVIEDIISEENNHVGQLQQLLDVVNRDIKNIADGIRETKRQIKK